MAAPAPRLAVRIPVAHKANYEDYRPEVREHADYACSYCSISEIEAATIRFDIDHYYPKAKYTDLINHFPNLYYSCMVCNGHKLAWDPSDPIFPPTARILRYDLDDWSAHIAIHASNPDCVDGKTPEGSFHIDYLYLNHQNLRRIRAVRRANADIAEYVAGGARRLRRYHFDRLPATLKGPFIQARRRLLIAVADQDDRLENLIEAISAHPNADPDPTMDEQRKARHKMLTEMGVIKSRKRRNPKSSVKS